MSKLYDSHIARADALTGASFEELLLLVGDREKGNKAAALTFILDMNPDQVYPYLDSALRNDDNADLRNGAMEVFVAFGSHLVPQLLALLNDGNEEVRNFSTVMLGDIGNRSAVSALIEALKDPDANVRHGAAEALGKIGDRSALAPLMELLKEDFWLQYPAIVALGGMRDKCAAPALLELLDNEILMKPVIDALGKIGDQRALFTLCKILGTYTDTLIAGSAVRAIVSICRELDTFKTPGTSYNHFQEAQLQHLIHSQGIQRLVLLLRQGDTGETVSAAVALLGWLKYLPALSEFFSLLDYDEYAEVVEESILMMGQAAVPFLVETLTLPVDVKRVMAARLIGRLGDREHLTNLIPLLCDDSEEVQKEVLEALVGVVDASMAPRLMDLVQDGEEDLSFRASEVLGQFPYQLIAGFMDGLVSSVDPSRRRKAAILLVHLKGAEAGNLMRLLAGDRDADVRRMAITALGTRKEPAGIPVLISTLSDPDEGVCADAIMSLAGYGTRAPLQELLALLDSASDHIACAIVRAVGKIGSESAGEKLLDYLLTSRPSQQVEVLIVETLGKLGYAPASEMLKETSLRHCNPDMRRLAIQSLAEMRDVSSLEPINIACKDPHWSVRIAALHAAQKQGGEQSLPLLVAALSDPDYMVRKNAIIAMGESAHLEVIPKLVEQLVDHEVGKYAFSALYNFGHKGLPLIHQMLTDQEPAEIRIRLIDLIGKLGDRRSVKPLMRVLDDSSHAIRLAAIDALIFCFDGRLLKKLSHLKRYDRNEKVKEKAGLALRALTMEKFF